MTMEGGSETKQNRHTPFSYLVPYNTEAPTLHLPVTIGAADVGRELSYSDRPTRVDAVAFVLAVNMLLSKEYTNVNM
jgi:hypothetical protein